MPLRSGGAVDSEYAKGRANLGLESIGKGIRGPQNIGYPYNPTSGVYGCEFYVLGDGGFPPGYYYYLNASGDYLSYRFIAQNTKIVDKVRLICGTAFSPPEYTLEIQSDDGTGKPSGIVLTSGTFTPSTGEVIVDVTNYQLTKGITYHIVIYSPYATSSLWAGFPAGKPAFSPTNRDVVWSDDGGATWTVRNEEPVYLIEYADGTFEGQVYCTFPTVWIATGAPPGEVGEEFTPAISMVVKIISFLIRRSAGIPADDCHVVLKKNDVTIEDGIIVKKEDITDVFTWYTYTFSAPRILTAGSTHKIYLTSPGSSSDNPYETILFVCEDVETWRNHTYDGITSRVVYLPAEYYNDRDAAFKFA